MSICDGAVESDAKNDVVADNVIQSDLLGENARRVLRYSVEHLSDFAVRYSVNRLAVAPPVFIASGSVMMRIPVGADFDPIGREPLRYVNLAVDRRDRATVARIVRGAVPWDPYGLVQRRADHWYRVLTHQNLKIFERRFLRGPVTSLSRPARRKDQSMAQGTGRSCI